MWARRRVGLGALLSAGVCLCWLLISAGRPSLLAAYSYSSAIYDRHGKLLHLSLAADQRYRLYVPVTQMAPQLVEATLLYEDRYFYWHPGVNPVALAKAAWDTFVGHRRGASTITMQLARLRFGIDSTSIGGKLLQIARSLQLELYYSKQALLEAYLNIAPYGGNIEGAAAASLVYFGKDVRELSLAEALALAVMPQSPTGRSPTPRGEEPSAMLEARGRLARFWIAEHPHAETAQLGADAPLALHRRGELPFLAPHVSTRLAKGGARVHTTLDLQLQGTVERVARAYIDRESSEGLKNTAVMLVDHRSMEVLASLGSADFFDARILGQVDGTRAKRSPGSALKPFVYALALQRGLIHPKTLLKDAPMRFGAYNPENFDGDFEGPISATQALAKSRNVPAVYLETELHRAGGARAGLYGLLEAAGVSHLAPPEHYGLALVLGGLEVTMEELVQLYAMLAHGGRFRPLRYLLEGKDVAGTRLLSPEAAALTLAMLEEAERPNQSYQLDWVRDEVPVSWKTGTSYGFRDAWTVGVVGPYVLAVWVGNFDARGNPAFVGRRAAAPLFFALVDALRPEVRAASTARHAGKVRQVQVCATSGQLPTEYCPRTESVGFIPGVSPIQRCTVHRQVHIDIASGLRACPGETDGTRAVVMEFWPSDLLRLFARAGLPRAEIPPYASRCGFAGRSQAGVPPRITSPQEEVVYELRASQLGEETIPLVAVADADVRELRWFIGARLVGRTARDEPLLWRAEPGKQVVRVVDDSGRADALSVRVSVVE